MDTDFWIERWKEGRTGFHQQEINVWLRKHLNSLGLHAGARIFVPLCGKSSDMLWLADQGYSVLGVEISPLAVESFFQENEITVTSYASDPFRAYKSGPIEILQGNFFDLQPADLQDITGVYDRAALVALPPEMRQEYAAHLGKILSEGTGILLLTFDYPEELRSGPPFSVTPDEVHALFSRNFTIRMLDETMNGIGGMNERVFLLHRRAVR
jgi:thiopurine S-methyltransferase